MDKEKIQIEYQKDPSENGSKVGDQTIQLKNVFNTKIFDTLTPEINISKIYEKEQSPERVEEYLSFCHALIRHLPAEEREDFANDPVKFTSKTFIFRGLSPDKYESLKNTGAYKLQNGEMGSVGVFFTNRPFGAFTYQNKGILAVIPRDNMIIKSPLGIFVPGDNNYRKESKRLIDKGVSVYEVDNYYDLENPVAGNPNERYLHMRLEQPIDVTDVFLVWDNGEVREENVRRQNKKAA